MIKLVGIRIYNLKVGCAIPTYIRYVHEEYMENGIVKIKSANNWASSSHSPSFSMNKGYKYDILVWFCFDTPLCNIHQMIKSIYTANQ